MEREGGRVVGISVKINQPGHGTGGTARLISITIAKPNTADPKPIHKEIRQQT